MNKNFTVISIALVAAVFMGGSDVISSNDIPLVDNSMDFEIMQAAHAQTSRNSPNTVEIGVLLPLTSNGVSFERGESWGYAVNMAVDDFNEYLNDSNANWRLEANVMDTEGVGTTTIESVSEMHDDGIEFFVGPAFSGNVDAVIKQYIIPNSAKIALVSPSSTSVELAIDDNVFRLAVADDKQSRVIADLLYKDGKKVIIPVWANDPFGRGLAESTVAEFEARGGMADYTTNPDDGVVRQYERCNNTYKTCIGDQFPDMVKELADTVTGYVQTYGSDNIAIVFVGFELVDFINEAKMYPILRSVEWMGSDADALDQKLERTESAEFLTDVNFRAPIFSVVSDTDRKNTLTEMITEEYPNAGSDVYVYSSYDSVWAIGLAIEAAGGADSAFDDIVSEVTPIVNAYDQGALGDITLNIYGDIDAGDYTIWGIESNSWTNIGVYNNDTTFKFDKDYMPDPVINIGALVTLGGISNGIPPSASVFLDDGAIVAATLAELDFNKSHPNMEIDLVTVDTSYGALPALNDMKYGTYDEFYMPQLMALIDEAKNTYAEENSFDSLEATIPYTGTPEVPHLPSLTFSFAVERDATLDFLSLDIEPRPPRFTDAGLADRTPAHIFAILSPDDAGDTWQPQEYAWSDFFSPDNHLRALLTYHEPSNTIVGAAYYTPAGNGDASHEPALRSVIESAITHVRNNGGLASSLLGTYDGVSSPFYSFIIDPTGTILSTSLEANSNNSARGSNLSEIKDIDKSMTEINASLVEDGDTTWISYTFNNPATGLEEHKRSLLMQATIDGTEYIFGSGYYPPTPITHFVGPTSSGNVENVINTINGRDYISISPSSTATVLAEDDNVFRLTPTNAGQIPPLAELIESDENTHIVIVQRGDVWAQDLVDEFIADDRFDSYRVVEPLLPQDLANFDYAAAAQALEDAITASIERADDNPDNVAVLHVVFSDDMIELFTEIDKLDESSPIFSVQHYTADGTVNVSAVTDHDVVGPLIHSLDLRGVTFDPPHNEISNNLADRLADMGITYNAYYSSMYDAVWLAAKSILLSTDDYSPRAILGSAYVDEDTEDDQILAVIADDASPFPYVGALNNDQGISLDSNGDMVGTLQDFPTYQIKQFGDTYSWIPTPPTGTISGTIFNDSNDNGLYSEGEAGIEGVMVYLVDLDGVSKMTVTDANGSYMFERVPAEQHLVYAVVNESYNHTYVVVEDSQNSTVNLGYR